MRSLGSAEWKREVMEKKGRKGKTKKKKKRGRQEEEIGRRRGDEFVIHNK